MNFETAFLQFLKANGIDETPEIRNDTGMMLGDYKPTKQWVWGGNGALELSVSIALHPQTESGALGLLDMLQAFYKRKLGAQVPWSVIINPPKSTGPTPHVIPIGPAIAKDTIRQYPQLDQSKQYFLNVGTGDLPPLGAQYVWGNRTFYSVTPTPFSRFWMEVVG